MSTLDEKLKDIYLTYKNDKYSPIPIELLREYLELIGELEDEK